MKILPSTPTERGRLLLALGGLLAIAGLAYWIQVRPVAEPGSPAVTAAERIQATGALPVPETVRFGSLEDVPVLAEAGRNPFAYGMRPAPPPPPAPILPVAPPSLSVPVPPPAPSGPPPIPLKLTGMTQAETGGRFLVTLQDPTSRAVYVGYEGDVVDGRYRIVRVGAQSVVVSYLDGTGLRTLQLGG